MNDWRNASACRDTHPAVFYPTPDPHANARKVRTDLYAAARIVCDGCPVQADCLTEAVTNGDPYGFRAGLTPDEIADIIMRRTGTHTVRKCEWCGEPYMAGPKAFTRKYCGEACIKAVQGESSRQYKLRLKQARGAA